MDNKKRFSEISQGVRFSLIGGDSTHLKIKPVGISGGDPWHPGKGDRVMNAVSLQDGNLVEIPDQKEVVVNQ